MPPKNPKDEALPINVLGFQPFGREWEKAIYPVPITEITCPLCLEPTYFSFLNTSDTRSFRCHSECCEQNNNNFSFTINCKEYLTSQKLKSYSVRLKMDPDDYDNPIIHIDVNFVQNIIALFSYDKEDVVIDLTSPEQYAPCNVLDTINRIISLKAFL